MARESTSASSPAPGDAVAARAPPGGSRRLLEPDERLSEILFGLIMVISITGTISVATGGREEVGTLLRGAVGCNLAWGITDAVMYLLSTLVVRGRGIAAWRAVRGAAHPRDAHAVIAGVLPPNLAAALSEAELEPIRRRLAAAPGLARPRLGKEEVLAAAGVCGLVFLSTFPVVIPFLLVADATRALRISQAIAIVLLFLLGWETARHMGSRPWVLGLAMVALGAGLVAIVVALGG